MPGVPDHFSRCSAINAKGPALTSKLPPLLPLAPAEFKRAAEKDNTIVLDIRHYDAFGGQHVPGAWHIDFGGNFATFAGWVLPPDKDILLVAESLDQAQDASVWLRRVGHDHAAGYLQGGMFAWSAAGLPAAHVRQLSASELHRLMTKGGPLSLVDVRAPREYEADHIDGAVNIPAPDLRKRFAELDKTGPVVLVCSTGHRSSLAAGIIEQHGFEDVYNVAGGMTGYVAAGFAAECAMCMAPHLPAFSGK
jgi:hydroxyacylglutathione hydrolase